MKTGWNRFKKWLAGKLFKFVTANVPDKISEFIQERALDAALPVVMAFLDREGIIHCHLCTNRRGPLQNIEGMVACPKHVEAVQKIAVEKRKITLVAA